MKFIYPLLAYFSSHFVMLLWNKCIFQSWINIQLIPKTSILSSYIFYQSSVTILHQYEWKPMIWYAVMLIGVGNRIITMMRSFSMPGGCFFVFFCAQILFSIKIAHLAQNDYSAASSMICYITLALFFIINTNIHITNSNTRRMLIFYEAIHVDQI